MKCYNCGKEYKDSNNFCPYCGCENCGSDNIGYMQADKTFTVNGVSFEMIFVEGGTFTMGATAEQGSDAYDWEKTPAHQVTLSSYSIGQTEVTQALWKAVMENNPSEFKGDDLPVENVRWISCQEFIKKLNQLTGQNFRLPTEAEWEFAARGGNKSKGYKYAGSNNLDEVAWYKDNSNDQTHPVATKRPNELGIYDMSGNVWEWCQDWDGDYSSSSQTNPKGPNTGSYRVNRGGGWGSGWGIGWGIDDCRVSYRNGNNPSYGLSYLGFRLCLSEKENNNLEPKKEEIVPQHQPQKNQSPIPQIQPHTFTINDITFEMIPVEGGTFTMGTTAEQDDDTYKGEYPTPQVTLSSYSIGQTEVTQALWKAVMGNNPSMFKGDDLPVEFVSWNDCQKFIKKLNQLTGQNFRLPTEAEWEFAARGGKQSKGYKYAGSNNIDEVAWYKDNSNEKTHPVATKRPNELGIYDMSGNVWEWCQDWYGKYTSDSQTNPQGPQYGQYGCGRIIRSGGFDETRRGCHVSDRFNFPPDDRDYFLGFRLCLSEKENNNLEPKKDLCLSEKENNNLEPKKEEIVPQHQPQKNQSPIPQIQPHTFTINDITFEMIPVEGDTFTMGATPEQGDDAGDNEKPAAHQVTLSSYSIGKTEVTQALWKAVMGNNPSRFKGDNLPVECVSWDDCQEFIQKLNQLTGQNFRLPTEAEWEFAARGGNKSKGYKYAGSNNIDDVAWYYDNSNDKTHPVGTKRPNELGIYDMSGNVYEWCQDWYGYYLLSSQTNPKGPNTGSGRVLRGGSWGGNAGGCRVSLRLCSAPCISYNYLGFRLCLP